MGKLEESQAILRAFRLPVEQQNPMSAYTLLALAEVRPTAAWGDAGQPLLRVRDIIRFITSEYGQSAYDRETVRRQALHQFDQARLATINPDKPRPTNSGQTCYALTNEALAVIRLYGSAAFASAVTDFLAKQPALQDLYRAIKVQQSIAVALPEGVTAYLSSGRHNELQADVVRHFYPNFVPKAQLLYLGDTAKKSVFVKKKVLREIGLPFSEHDKFPDLVFWWEERRWLVLVEAVTTHGPFSPKRKKELEDLLKGKDVHPIFVTAFPSWKEFKQYVGNLAWDTEVWIAEEETRGHMIHFNGPKFLGPVEAGVSED